MGTGKRVNSPEGGEGKRVTSHRQSGTEVVVL